MDRQPLEELIQYLGYERESTQPQAAAQTPLASDALAERGEQIRYSELLVDRDQHGEVKGAGW